jgi:heat shock protein HtpX
MSAMKTSLLLATLTALFGAFGLALDLVLGTGGVLMTVFLIIGLAMNWVSYWFSDKIVLKMFGAQVVTDAQAPELHAMTRRLAQRAGIPMPRLAIIPMDMPNAFATGRNPQNGVVAVTQGIMRILTKDELEGVIAHEIGHIKNRDTLISTIAASIAGAIGTLANMAQFGLLFGGGSSNDENPNPLAPIILIVMAITAPIIALVIQMAISRTREFGADRAAAEMTGNPSALSRALQRLEYAAEHGMEAAQGQVPQGTQHMFIVNPMMGTGLSKLFSTHPPTADRVAALRKVEAELRTSGRLRMA